MDTATSISGHKWTLLQVLVDISKLLQVLVDISEHCY